MMAVRHLLLIRHGETAASADGLFTGRSDVPLTETGRRQARAWRATTASIKDMAAFTSPLSRAVETAALAGLRAVEIVDDLMEWDLGPLEGLVADAHRIADPDWNLYDDGPGVPGESPGAVAARAASVLERVQALPQHVAVLVSHGQFLRVLTAVALEVPLPVASRFSLGPARAGMLTLRANGRLSLTGWNLPGGVGASLFRELT